MKIKDILARVDKQPYMKVSVDSRLEEVAAKAAEKRNIRGIYVVNEDDQLCGYLSLGTLIRHVIAARREPQFHPRTLLTYITSKKISDIMEKHVIFAHVNQEVKDVIEKMLDINIKEIPVVDQEMHIINIVGILDLWRIEEKVL